MQGQTETGCARARRKRGTGSARVLLGGAVSTHAVRRMLKRAVRPPAVIVAIRGGLVVEEHEDDIPFPAFLIAHRVDLRPIYVVVARDPASGTGARLHRKAGVMICVQ